MIQPDKPATADVLAELRDRAKKEIRSIDGQCQIFARHYRSDKVRGLRQRQMMLSHAIQWLDELAPTETTPQEPTC